MSDTHSELEESYDEDEQNNNSIKKEINNATRTGKPAQSDEESESDDDPEVSENQSHRNDSEQDDHTDQEEYTDDDENAENLPPPPSTVNKISTAIALPTKKMPREAPKHPTYQIMVDEAINKLNERVGSSVQAIKKYILSNFGVVDSNRVAFYIYKYIKKAMLEGKLKQTKQKYKLIKDKVKKLTKEKKEKEEQPKKVATKKMAVKETATMLKKSAPKNNATTTSKAVNQQPAPQKKGAKSAVQPKKIVAKKATPTAKSVAAKAKPTASTAKKPAAGDTVHSKAAPKKQVAKPTLKIVPTTSRKSLSLLKKKPANQKGARHVAAAAAENVPPVEKRAPRATRGASKK